MRCMAAMRRIYSTLQVLHIIFKGSSHSHDFRIFSSSWAVNGQSSMLGMTFAGNGTWSSMLGMRNLVRNLASFLTSRVFRVIWPGDTNCTMSWVFMSRFLAVRMPLMKTSNYLEPPLKIFVVFAFEKIISTSANNLWVLVLNCNK